METKLKKRPIPSKEVSAINFVEISAKRMALDHPEIADEWKNGKIVKEIANEYFPELKSKTTKANIISKALKILIPKEERVIIATKHWRANANRCRADGHRILSMPREERQAFSKINYEKGKGLASMTAEERVVASRKGNIAQGRILYDDKKEVTPLGLLTEKEYILRLRTRFEPFKLGDWILITSLVNAVFKNNRTHRNISVKYSQWNHKLLKEKNNPEK